MTIKELKERYGFKTEAAVRKLIYKNLELINSDGEHAKQSAEGWQLDDEAVKTLDDLRGLNKVSVINQAESERIKELSDEVEKLKDLLLLTQSKLITAQENNQKALIDKEKTFRDLEIENAVLKNEIENLRESLNYQKELTNLKREQIDKILNRTFVERLFNLR